MPFLTPYQGTAFSRAANCSAGIYVIAKAMPSYEAEFKTTLKGFSVLLEIDVSDHAGNRAYRPTTSRLES